MDSHPSDEDVYRKLLSGELAAFDVLYQRYERHLLGFIRVHVHDAAEAEDVLHDAFVSILREGRAGRAARRFKPWLFQVARHLCLNRRRSAQRGERASRLDGGGAPASGEATPQGVLEALEASGRLHEAVAALPPGLAELYRLRASGLSYAELASVLKVKLGTVKSRIHELVDRLKQEVRE